MYTPSAATPAYALYDQGGRQLLREHLELLADLRRAIDDDRARPALPAQDRPDRQAVTGAEALVRWEHPERGFLLPDAFIALAETPA